MTQFTDLGLAEPILRALGEEGYENPTPIQAQAIPALLEGRDLLGTAQTGSGKTAAFVLPLLNRIASADKRPAPKHCRVLILSPTRELSAQILESVRTYGRHMRISSTLVVGGVKPGPQIRALAKGVDILVATPGRLLDHARSGAVNLSKVDTLILDEADQMLDLGFFPAIRQVVAQLPKERQTALLSATMPKPIRALAHDLLTDPKQVAVDPVSRPVDRIDQQVVMTTKDAKKDLLLEFLSDRTVERAIVFTRTKHGADKVMKHLVKYGLKAAAIHGNKSQAQRIKALDGFKTGSITILVATDIAARGIDVDGVSHVINFELPNIPESYVHRIGRTARAGRSGIAISLCDPTERDYLRDIEKLTGAEIEKSFVGDEAEFHRAAEAAKPVKKKRKRSSRSGSPHLAQGPAPSRQGEGGANRPASRPRRNRRRSGQGNRQASASA